MNYGQESKRKFGGRRLPVRKVTDTGGTGKPLSPRDTTPIVMNGTVIDRKDITPIVVNSEDDNKKSSIEHDLEVVGPVKKDIPHVPIQESVFVSPTEDEPIEFSTSPPIREALVENKTPEPLSEPFVENKTPEPVTNLSPELTPDIFISRSSSKDSHQDIEQKYDRPEPTRPKVEVKDSPLRQPEPKPIESPPRVVPPVEIKESPPKVSSSIKVNSSQRGLEVKEDPPKVPPVEVKQSPLRQRIEVNKSAPKTPPVEVKQSPPKASPPEVKDDKTSEAKQTEQVRERKIFVPSGKFDPENYTTVSAALIKADKPDLPDRPDYSHLNSEEKAAIRAKFTTKFAALRQTYSIIPNLTGNEALEDLYVTYERWLRYHVATNSAETYRTYMLVLFVLIELGLTKGLGLNAQGYTQAQFKAMHQYDMLLFELGEKYFVTYSSGWPVEVRLVFTAAVNAVIFVGLRYLLKWLNQSEDLSNTIHSTIVNFLWPNKTPAVTQGGGNQQSSQQTDDGGLFGGFDINNVLKSLPSLLGSFGQAAAPAPNQPAANQQRTRPKPRHNG